MLNSKLLFLRTKFRKVTSVAPVIPLFTSALFTCCSLIAEAKSTVKKSTLEICVCAHAYISVT